MVVVESQADEY